MEVFFKFLKIDFKTTVLSIQKLHFGHINLEEEK